MTNTDKIICQYPSCQLRAQWFIYSGDPDSTTADVFLCKKHWKKGKVFFDLLHRSFISADFRDDGFEPLVKSS